MCLALMICYTIASRGTSFVQHWCAVWLNDDTRKAIVGYHALPPTVATVGQVYPFLANGCGPLRSSEDSAPSPGAHNSFQAIFLAQRS